MTISSAVMRTTMSRVALPVLAVHAGLAHGAVQPQAVALVAVVEHGLELERRVGAALGAAPAATATAPALGRVGLAVVGGRRAPPPARPRRGGGLLGGRGRGSRLARLRRGGLRLGGDRLEVGLDHVVDGRAGRLVAAPQVVLAAEARDRRRRGAELVGDPDVGRALLDPGSDLVELRFERGVPASQDAERVRDATRRRPHASFIRRQPPYVSTQAAMNATNTPYERADVDAGHAGAGTMDDVAERRRRARRRRRRRGPAAGATGSVTSGRRCSSTITAIATSAGERGELAERVGAPAAAAGRHRAGRDVSPRT